MGWWEANLATECYTCSEYISEILNLDETGTISFEDFNKRILNEEQGPTTVRSFDVQSMSEVVYLLKTQKGSVWMRSKICFREVDDKGNTIVYGIAEMQDGPDTAIACQALQRSERLLHNIYKNLPVGIELYNKEGVLVDLNDKELDLFHVDSKEELLGINIFENPVFPEEMKERLRNNEDADFTFRYDFSKLGEYYSNNKAEGTIDLVTKVTTLYDENHNPVNYLLINADKTETTVAYNKIQEFYGLNPETVTAQDVVTIVKAWQKAVVGLDKMVYEDAKKEFSLSSMTGFGVDGSRDDMKQDFEQVRGDFESNTFVTAVLKHIEDKTALGNELIKRIEHIQ